MFHLYNGTNQKNIYPTPVIGGVGLINKVMKSLLIIYLKMKIIF